MNLKLNFRPLYVALMLDLSRNSFRPLPKSLKSLLLTCLPLRATKPSAPQCFAFNW